jgi:hypothetical protein
MRIDGKIAERILRAEAEFAASGVVDARWAERVERLSQLCEDGVSKTHVAFLGTEILARAVDGRADMIAIKPKLAPDNPNAYSARSLCHSVLVPLSAELGFSLGVTGREPLNNQPYFRMSRLGDDTPVHQGGRKAFDYMVELVNELSSADSSQARGALRAFIAVRRRYLRAYGDADTAVTLTPERLLVAITTLVGNNSEGGRRAQAVVAGLLDVVVGTGRVESGRVNDPSRHYPGDVAVLAAEGEGVEIYEKAFEVRDKPVAFSDIVLFGRTCLERGAREAAVVMVWPDQPPPDDVRLREWSAAFGLSLTLFQGWRSVVEQCLFWAPPPKPDAAGIAVETIRDRLIGVEASPAAVQMWDSLTRRE